MPKKKEYDPIAELIKYAFMLKVDLGRYLHAQKLENLVDELVENEADTDFVVTSVLILLNELKNTQSEDEKTLVI